MARRLVDMRDAQAFMERALPKTTPAKLRHTAALRFYSWLVVTGVQKYGVVVICPHCHQQHGKCRCPQLGFQWEAANRNDWTYKMEATAAVQWHLDVKSLMSINPARLNRSSPNERRLAEFIAYLKRL